jgi:tetratricopeptide (TPR) repeat protein
MAKHRRARARPPAPQKTTKSAERSRVRRRPSPSTSPGRSALPTADPAPVLRTAYVEAVALYERGLQAVQAHDYDGAADLLRSVLTRYPDEKELHERVRLYLNVCERQIAPRQAATPRSVQERIYAATLALNGGEYAQVLSHIESVLHDEPDNDHAHYVRAVALTLGGDLPRALRSLTRAIELNSENRAVAKQDPDLEALRSEDSFCQTIDAISAGPRQERRRHSPRDRASH